MTFCMCSWARKTSDSVKIFTVALLVHVLMVKLLLLQVILQNNGVTFDLISIFFDRHCEISMLFYQPGKFAASFCGLGESYLNMCLSIFPAFAVDIERNSLEWTEVLRLNLVLGYIA